VVPHAAQNDSIELFQMDMAKIVHKLRPFPDKTLPAVYLSKHSTRLSYTNLWTKDMWEEHSGRMRYVRALLDFHKSRLLRLMAPQLFVLVMWSVLTVSAGSLMKRFLGPLHLGFARFKVPLTPLSILSTLVAALLTLRTNTGLTRLLTGRSTWGRLLSLTRDTAQLLAAYVYPVDPQLGLLSARHLAIFGWLLKTRLRDEKDDDITSAALSEGDAAYVQSQRKKAVACIQRIRQVVAHLSKNNRINRSAQLALEQNLLEMNHLYGACEGLISSPIPPLYTSNSSRLLVFYLALLPIALDMLNVMSAVGIVLVTAAVGYAMLGMDEITHQLEQPFRVIPMHQLSVNILRDVSDAFVSTPPPLPGVQEVGAVDGDKPAELQKPAYW